MANFEDIPTDIVQIIKAHIQQYLTDPEKAHIWDARPLGLPGPVTTLLLTTIGRKTGKARHVPLLYVENDGGGYMVIGSKGGNEEDPIWYLNLQETPECEIRISTLHTKAHSRPLKGDAYEAAWKKITAQHPVYLKYQARAERQIPVILLEPITG
jgi:deazaflavin-dependent oxidoreductase (nitroreductase family)